MATVYCRPDGTVVSALHGTLRAPDPAWIVLEVTDLPRDLTRVRWDGATGLREATAPEIAAAQAAALDQESADALDTEKALKALALVVGDLTSQTPQQMRTRFIQKYKSL